MPVARTHLAGCPACALHSQAHLPVRRPARACAANARSQEGPAVASEEGHAHRRGAVFSLAASILAWQPAARALGDSLRYGTWDGTSAAGGSCPIGDPGVECRKKLLLRDKLDTSVYGKAVSPKSESGTAVAEMNDSYSQETLKVAEVIQQYASTDPFSPDRPGIVKTLKQDGGEWAAKYARGGNARKQSARRFYIAYDALLGHLVTSGMAPMPQAKLDKVLQNVDQAKELMAAGK